MTTVNFDRIKEHTQEAIASERDWDRIMAEPIPLEMVMIRLKNWTKWYLKKNQPKNFFRITRIIPKEFIDNSSTWRHRLQLFIKNKFDHEVIIDADTFHFISTLEGWEKVKDALDTQYIFHNRNAAQVPMFRYEVSYTSLALHRRRTVYSNQVVKTYEGTNEACIPYRIRKKVDFKIISIQSI